MDAFVTTFAGTGVTIERLDHAGLVRHVPETARPHWCDAIYEPACADIDVAGLHQQLSCGRPPGRGGNRVPGTGRSPDARTRRLANRPP